MGCASDGYKRTWYMDEEITKKYIWVSGRARNIGNTN